MKSLNPCAAAGLFVPQVQKSMDLRFSQPVGGAGDDRVESLFLVSNVQLLLHNYSFNIQIKNKIKCSLMVQLQW